MKGLDIFKENEIQHWERYTHLLNENRTKINEIVGWINKRDKQLQVAREAKRQKSGG